MRCLLISAVLVVPVAASADSFLEVTGALMIPAGDSHWTDTAESSPKLGVSAGAVNEQNLGAMLHVDWTPVSLDNNGGSFGIGSANLAAHRFRIMAEGVLHKPVAPKIIASARVGLGIDIAHASAHGTILGMNFDSSDTDTGFAIEVAGGVWYDLGAAQVGGELAIPIANHNKTAANNQEYDFKYSSYDIDIVFGVRILAH